MTKLLLRQHPRLCNALLLRLQPDDTEKKIEEIHIIGGGRVLERCEYYSWTFKKVKKQMGMNKEQTIHIRIR